MAKIIPNLIMIRSVNVDVSLAFYQTLGLAFAEEQHGKGPVHHACEIDGFVFEIYPAESGNAPVYTDGGATMLGFQVDVLDDVLAELESIGIHPKTPPKESPWGRWCMVFDPDGRAVNLSEESS